jgi:hypothetical protein
MCTFNRSYSTTICWLRVEIAIIFSLFSPLHTEIKQKKSLSSCPCILSMFNQIPRQELMQFLKFLAAQTSVVEGTKCHLM